MSPKRRIFLNIVTNRSSSAKNVLLLTAETYSKYIHPMDKSVRTIFGDGAAAVQEDESAADEIGAFSFGTDGSGAENLIVRTGGAREAIEGWNNVMGPLA